MFMSRSVSGGCLSSMSTMMLVVVLSCLLVTRTTTAAAASSIQTILSESTSSSSLSTSLTPPLTPLASGRYDPLATWLWNLMIDIPDQHFKEKIFSLSILNMECTHFSVDAINSTYIPSSNDNSAVKNPAIDLSVAGITASCSGKYKSTGLSGTLSATVASSQPQALAMRLNFQSEQSNATSVPFFRMATAISMDDCHVHLKVSKLHFSGSISAKIINLFRSEIRNSVSGALSKQLCPALKGIMDDSLTKLIQQADNYMLGLIPDDAEQDQQVVKGTMMDDALPQRRQRRQRRRQRMMRLTETTASLTTRWKWNQDAPLVVTILHLVNMFLDRYLDQGFFLDAMKQVGLNMDAMMEQDHCGYFFHGINGLLRTLTGGRIEFGIPDQLQALKNITFVIPHYASISIMPKTVGIAGIDHLDHLTLLQPIRASNTNDDDDDESFWTKLQATQGLNITVSLAIQIAAIPGGAFRGDPLIESFHLSINTTSLDVTGNLTLNVNRTRFEKTTLNHMINGISGNQADVGCCLYPIETFGVDELLATVGMQSISIVPHEDGDKEASQNTAIGGTLERDIDGMLNSFLSLFLTEYQTLVTLAFSGLVNGPAKNAAQKFGNALLQSLVHDSKADDVSCAASGIVNVTAHPVADYLNFSNAKILKQFNRFLNNTSTIGDANKYLECISNVLATQVRSTTPKLEYGGASLQLKSVVVEDAGSIENIELLSPQADGYHLSNSLEIGTCTGPNASIAEQTESCKRPRLIAATEISVASMNFSGSANLSASVGSFQDSISALLLLDLNQLRNLTIAKLVSCHSCFLKPAAEAVLYAAPQVFHHLSFGISAQATRASMDPISVELDSVNYTGATSKVKSLFSWTQMSFVDAINRIVAHKSNAADANCDRGNDNEGDASHDQSAKVSATLSIMIYLLPFYILAHILYIAYNQLKSQEESYEPLIEFEQGIADDEMFTALREKDSSLMTKEKASSALRHAFPVVLVGTIALLIASNLSVGASVDLTVSTADTQGAIRLPALFDFSLGNTIHDMYHAGIYVLLFIVVIFSGIWPYLKLCMMLWGWMAPESIFSVKKRGKLLFSLDALSKFSLVDTFVLIIMMVSFRFHLALGDSATIDVFVNPLFGFYGFLVATTVSLLAGHVELHVHRQSIARENETEDNSKISLFSHQFTFEGKRYRFSSKLKMSLAVAMATTIALLAVGSFMQSFTFEFGGLAGVLLGNDNKKMYSLVSIGTSLPESVEDPNGPGIMFLQVVYFFYACIMPFACLGALSILLVVPMTALQQESWLTAAEVANAWSAIEVFALSILAALFEISTFASFIVGNKCDIINTILEDQFNDFLDGDDVCYSVTASVGGNVWFLILGVALNSFIVSKLLRVAQMVVEERGKAEDIRTANDDGGDRNHDEAGDNIVHRWIKSAFGKCLFEVEEMRPLTEPLLSNADEIVEMVPEEAST